MVTVYQKLLQSAIERTKGLGMMVDDFYIDKTSFPILTEAKSKALVDFLSENVYHLPINKVAFRCSIHSFIRQKEIEKVLNTTTLLTVGYFEFRGINHFHNTDETISEWMKNRSINERAVHVWLTLPSLEIIDITVIASLLKIDSTFLGVDMGHVNYQNCIIGRPDDLQGERSIIHKPQYVGIDFLNRIGMAAPALIF